MQDQIIGRYYGQRGPLFRLYLVTALLTLVTLGIYRFWARTRIRKYVWSGISGDEDSFEYTGTGLEKFLGFLLAIVILAVYLGIVQMALFYFGLTLFTEPQNQAQALAQIGAIYITLLAVLPLILFAQYRARRYKMARSRWRGLRFGMEHGAWGYVGRALVLYALNILTLGLLNPLVSFKLEEYMTNRSWYGDAQFVQQGRWQDLYAGMKHVFIGLGGIVLAAITLAWGAASSTLGMAIAGSVLGFAAYIWFLIGLVYYRVFAFNYLTQHKVLDGVVRFDAALQTGRIISIVVVGTLVIGVLMAVLFGVVGGIIATLNAAVMQGNPALLVLIAAIYAFAFMVAGGLSLVMITQPVIAHAVENIRVFEPAHLATIQQRVADTGADAEGFADALDVGGAL